MQTQVTALEVSVLALQTEVATLSAGLAALQEEVAALGATVAGLGLTVAGLTLTVGLQGLQISGLQSDVSHLQSAFDQATVTLLGDVVGIGLLNQAVATKFSPDPVFTGGAVTLPSGDTTSRPETLVAGMFRYNTSPF